MFFPIFSFFYFFFFPKLSSYFFCVFFILFFKYRAGWEFSFVVFLKKTLWIATVFPHMVFFLFLWFFLWFFLYFFHNSLCRFYFFLYWAGWEFSFMVFFLKTLWIATVFPHMIFFCYDFFQNCFYQFYYF